MNRRNFILGLGTAATLSGAASVTSAALSNSTQPGADFRIISNENIEVRRNSAIVANSEVDNSLSNYVNSSNDFVPQEGDLNFTSGSGSDTLNTSTEPNLTVSSGPNDALNMSLAVPNDNQTDANRNESLGGTAPYNSTSTGPANAPLVVENLGNTQQEVAVEYGYGTDAGAPGGVAYSDINQLFTFSVNGTQISPSPSTANGDNSSNTYTFDVGEQQKIDFDINYSSHLEEVIRQNSSAGAGFGGGTDNINLIDIVEFGNP